MSAESEASILARMNAQNAVQRPRFGGPPQPGAFDPRAVMNPLQKQFVPDKDSLNVVLPMQVQIWMEPTLNGATTEWLLNMRALIDKVLSQRVDARK